MGSGASKLIDSLPDNVARNCARHSHRHAPVQSPYNFFRLLFPAYFSQVIVETLLKCIAT